MSLLLICLALATAKRVILDQTIEAGSINELLQASIYKSGDIFGTKVPRIVFNITIDPLDSSPTIGEPYLNLLVLTLEQTDEVFEYLGESLVTDRSICCTGLLCQGELSMPSGLEKSALRIEKDAEFTIEESGYYYIIAVNCQQIEYSLSGTVEIINPYGYLPGVDGMLLAFYPALAAFYTVHSLLWFIWLMRYWKSTVMIQKAVIPAVLLTCILESGLKAADFWVFNEYSVQNGTLATTAILAVSWKGALARILMLVVCKGWGVVSDTVSGILKIAGLGCAYFGAATAYFKIRQQIHAQGATAILKHTFMVTSVPLSIIDSIFFSWTIYCLSHTKQKLEDEHQTYKLGLFRILSLVLYSAVGIAVIVLFSEGYDVSRLNQNGVWQRIWMYEAAWNIIFCLVLVGITILWRPSSSSQLLATTQQLVSEDIDLDFESSEDRGGNIEMSSKSAN
mmetsp:Transcript_28675/g.51054  ORF Transcript_28675/g.51054 Transcript_28675/m.51054 type:complete len:452 (-) Transcript_28675:746-2101(-)|eukprot:CAMPEP_0204905604 /NCGR_PEP_ID=MMETSP1397-20131031/5512_1 /ASSEMBLY_ACC=CAM_ASM_000891 /TAXON_ID=49980 /ORGANISM="Climacostomum Climacostomum virens, Strain Stock W-24" /LENGTH=451 /DNA_ID=CAMNT_0052074501 /DNA_START=411 /DNA_END=1766 /DNA_ORIENTATION=+